MKAVMKAVIRIAVMKAAIWIAGIMSGQLDRRIRFCSVASVCAPSRRRRRCVVMAQFVIEIKQGCVPTWKSRSKPIKISELRSLVQQSPQSFKGDVSCVEFRLERGSGGVLAEDFQVAKATTIFAKLPAKPAKSTGSSSAASSSKKASAKKASAKSASTKKDKDGDEIQVDLPTTAAGPHM